MKNKRISSKPRILLIAPGRHGRGGVVSMVHQLCASALKDKYEFHWLETQDDRTGLTKLYSFVKAWLCCPWLLLRSDLVHIHTASWNSFRRKTFFMTWCIWLRRPYVLHIHGGGFLDFMADASPGARAFYRYYLNHAVEIVMLARRFRSGCEKYLGRKIPIAVIPNFCIYPVQAREKRSPETLNILFAGWVEPEKGVFDLLQAFAAVCQTHWRLWILGKGQIENVRKLAARLKIGEQVETPGWIAAVDLPQYYRKADILVLPSYREGMPMVLLEAMAYGVPILATPVGGVPDLLPPGGERFCFPPGDVAALSRLLAQGGADAPRLAAWSRELQEYFTEHFDSGRLAGRWDELYSRHIRK